MSSPAFGPTVHGVGSEQMTAAPMRRWGRLAGFLFFLWTLLATSVITVVMAIVASIASFFDPSGARVWSVTLLWARSILFIAGVRVEVASEAALPDGPCIFVSNHQGAFDILALFVGLPRRFVFVAKKSLFSIPFLGWHIRAHGYIPVDRSNREAAIRSLRQAGERIRAGTSVAVFPEGTRSQDGSILPFKKGPFMLALQAGVPLVPVALEGSVQVNPKKSLYVCPNTVRLLVGPPVETEGLTEGARDDLMRAVRSTVIRLHRRLGGPGGDETDAIATAGSEGVGQSPEEQRS